MLTVLVVRLIVGFTRLLLCIQAAFIATIGWAALATLDPGAPWMPNAIAALLASAVAASGLAVASRMRPGRKWTAVSALAVEGLWAVVSLLSAGLPPGPPRWQYILGFGLALTAIAGLLLRPVRLYFGWAGTGIARPLCARRAKLNLLAGSMPIFPRRFESGVHTCG